MCGKYKYFHCQTGDSNRIYGISASVERIRQSFVIMIAPQDYYNIAHQQRCIGAMQIMWFTIIDSSEDKVADDYKRSDLPLKVINTAMGL